VATSSGGSIGILGQQGAIYALGNVLSRLGGFILLPLYLRVLSPSEYGILEMFYTTSAILAVFVSGGLAQAAMRFYFEYKDEVDRRSVITTALVAASGISVTTALALWPFAGPVSEMLVGKAEYASSFHLVLLTLVVQLTSEVGLNYLRVKNYPWRFVIASLGQLALQIVINIVTVAVLGLGVPGVLIGNLLGALVAGLIVVWIAVAECGWKWSTTKLFKMLQYTWPMIVAGIAAVFIDRADRFVLQVTLGLDAVGIYALAEKLAMIFAVGFLQPFRLAYGAYRFSIIDHPDRASLQRQVLRQYLLIASCIGLALVLAVPPLLKMISQDSYWSAAGLLPILMLRNVLSGAEYIFQTGILYAKKTRRVMVIQVSSGVLRVAATLLLVGVIGLPAPAYGALLGMAVAALTSMLVAKRYDRVDWRLFAVGRLLAIAVACFALAAKADGAFLASAAIAVGFVAACLLARVVSIREVREGYGAMRAWIRRRRGSLPE